MAGESTELQKQIATDPQLRFQLVDDSNTLSKLVAVATEVVGNLAQWIALRNNAKLLKIVGKIEAKALTQEHLNEMGANARLTPDSVTQAVLLSQEIEAFFNARLGNSEDPAVPTRGEVLFDIAQG